VAMPAKQETITDQIEADESIDEDRVDGLVRNDSDVDPSPGLIRQSSGDQARASRPGQLLWPTVLAATIRSHLGRALTQVGYRVFALEDAEAAWHAWDVEPRYAGLGRLYRDQRFDALVDCPRCHRVSTVAGSSVCKQCSAADRLVRA
jgi:hypothetical protein